jgi:hypothetical protein
MILAHLLGLPAPCLLFGWKQPSPLAKCTATVCEMVSYLRQLKCSVCGLNAEFLMLMGFQLVCFYSLLSFPIHSEGKQDFFLSTNYCTKGNPY